MKLNISTPAQNTRDDGYRTYTHPNGKEYPSVTTLLSAGLPNQFTAVTVRETVKSMREEPDQPDAWHKKAHERFLDDRAELGTQVHAYAEAIALGEDPPQFGPDEHPGYAARLPAVDAFFADYQPTPLHIETMVFNREHGYAGQGDFLGEFPGEGVGFVDYKTSADVYEKHQLQAVAYFNATELVVDGRCVPMPRVDFAAVVLFSEDGYRMERVPTGGNQFATFLAAKAVAEWRWNHPKTIPAEAVAPFAARPDVLEQRCRLLQTHGRLDALAAAWPTDVPTFKAARDAGVELGPPQLAAIAAAVAEAEQQSPQRTGAFETVGPRLRALPSDLLARLEVTLHDLPSIQAPEFTGAHHAAIDHYLGIAETAAAERSAQMAASIGVAGAVAELPSNDVIVGWVGGTDHIQQLPAQQHELACAVLDAIGDGYISVGGDGQLVATVEEPDEIINRAGGKSQALAAARATAKRLGLKSPGSSLKATADPLFVAAIAAAAA